jgi:hypothetical protein
MSSLEELNTEIDALLRTLRHFGSGHGRKRLLSIENGTRGFCHFYVLCAAHLAPSRGGRAGAAVCSVQVVLNCSGDLFFAHALPF